MFLSKNVQSTPTEIRTRRCQKVVAILNGQFELFIKVIRNLEQEIVTAKNYSQLRKELGQIELKYVMEFETFLSCIESLEIRLYYLNHENMSISNDSNRFIDTQINSINLYLDQIISNCDIKFPFINYLPQTKEFNYEFNGYAYRNYPLLSTMPSQQSEFISDLKIDLHTNYIYTCQNQSSLIKVYNQLGEYIRTINHDVIRNPVSLCINERYIYVMTNDLFVHQLRNDYLLSYRDYILKSISIPHISLVITLDKSSSDIFAGFSNPSTTSEIQRLDVNLNFRDKISLNKYKDSGLLSDLIVETGRNSIFVLFDDSYYSIQEFTMNGNLIKCLLCKNQINSPRKFCIDNLQNFLVADIKTRQIKIFSPTGSLITTLGDKCLFNEPSCVSINGTNRVFVADYNFKLHKNTIYIL